MFSCGVRRGIQGYDGVKNYKGQCNGYEANDEGTGRGRHAAHSGLGFARGELSAKGEIIQGGEHCGT